MIVLTKYWRLDMYKDMYKADLFQLCVISFNIHINKQCNLKNGLDTKLDSLPKPRHARG